MGTNDGEKYGQDRSPCLPSTALKVYLIVKTRCTVYLLVKPEKIGK